MLIHHCTKQLSDRRNFLRIIGTLFALATAGLNNFPTPAAAENTMPLNSPKDVHQAFAAAFNARDIEGMMAIYEPEAAVVPEPGKVVTGTADVRAAMEGYLAMTGKIQIETLFVIEAGDIALTRSRWEIRDGDKVSATASGAEVMRRGSDGTWRVIVDNPFGGEPAQ